MTKAGRLAALLWLSCTWGWAQKTTTVPVIMLSDLHVDPFHDPQKLPRLRAAGAAEWAKILAEPESAGAAGEFAKVNAACGMRGLDSPPALMESSLSAAKAAAPGALFVTVSGDLLAHDLDCRFKALAPKASDADYTAFATKTAVYVALELRRTFGKTPVYVALGNNDSGCGDYREASGSVFLRTLAASLAGAYSARGEARPALQQFEADGSYSVRLPQPVSRGRLIVLQDLFLSPEYKDCSGKPNAAGPAEELAWLSRQLQRAREAHEQVWVMAHIPVGVNVYATVKNRRDICAGQAPDFFLASDALASTLTQYVDVIRLVVFGHTHNDEMHLLRAHSGESGAAAVAIKTVPSVTPINGNLPAFTVAEVELKTGSMRDYRVFMADGTTGVDTKWTEEYRFSKLYGVSGYTAPLLQPLLDRFVADKSGAEQASADYAQKFFVGGGRGTLAVHLVWPQYACSMENHTEADYRSCVCAGK